MRDPAATVAGGSGDRQCSISTTMFALVDGA